MSNSNLVSYTKLSPHCNKPRLNKIDKITIHHMAAVNASIERCGEEFAKPDRLGSSNYGIGSDGRIGMYVEEKNRAWTSSSALNDHRAVTIEVANDGGAPDWHVSDKALAATIDLCVDICRRNGIKALNFTGDASGNLTMHRYFTATTCPGPYLASKFPYIAQEVNRRLASAGITPGKKEAPVEIVRQVIAGMWGVGLDRKYRLTKAGYDYNEVQARVNQILKNQTKKTDYEIAREVIAGQWGVGTDRKNRLAAAGYNYATIQKIVNSMLK